MPSFLREKVVLPSGVMREIHVNDEGDVTYVHKQDCEHILDNNHFSRNHVQQDKNAHMRKVASIPPVVALDWLQKYGINVFAPKDTDEIKRIQKLLDDPEYRFLRTHHSRLA